MYEPCYRCRESVDTSSQGWYEDCFGRYIFCTYCYVHAKHPQGRTLAWWYAAEEGYAL